MSDDQNTFDGFELINCIATGTHSQIWEVSEPGGSQHFAIKLLVPTAMAEKGNVATLKHEAKVQKSLVHPNFIPFHRVSTSKKHAYIVMDYFRAPNVKLQLMSDLLALQTRASKLIEGLCISLAYMHDKGWVHRDIKPENILFNKSGELKLIDFSLSVHFARGIGKVFGSAPKAIQGTRTYIAPETILKKPPSPRTDMYSLGITLFEVLAGQRPFAASNPDVLLNKHLKEAAPAPSEFNKNVTPEADQFVLRMLSKKPEKRHANMNELLAELRSLKLFKEDIAQLKARAEQEQKELDDAGGDLSKAWTLDSRRDAMLTEKGITPPSRPEPKKKPSPPQPAASTPPQQPVATPQQPPPAAAFPGQPQPGQFPQFAPPGFLPQGMYPPQPGTPMPQMPQQPYPQQQYPPPGFPPGYPQFPPAAPPVQQPPMPVTAQPVPQPQPAQQPPTHSAVVPPTATPQPAAAPPAQHPMPQPQTHAMPQPQTAQPATAANLQPQQSPADHISREDAELRPQAPITNDRHASQSKDDPDIPLMDELPDVG